MVPIQVSYIRLGMRAFRLRMGQKREHSPLSLRYPEKFRDLEPRFQTPHKQQQSPEPPPDNMVALLFAPPGVSHSALQNIRF